MENSKRPLSPHLQIYRLQWTMLYSILHRATGIIMSLGMVFLVAWVWALSSGMSSFLSMQSLAGSFIGKLFIFAVVYSFFYHLCNGLRHLFWDAGVGLELKTAEKSGPIMAGLATLLTLIFVIAYLVS